MKIGVIGIGEMGGTIARRWSENGHSVRVANSRGPEAVRQGVVILDVGNYYPEVRDPHIPEIDAGMPESVWTPQQLGRPLFKAFNSILFHALSELGKPEGAPDRLAIPVAGDDAGGSSLQRQLVVAMRRAKDAGRNRGGGQG